jgi:hypothetical protein
MKRISFLLVMAVLAISLFATSTALAADTLVSGTAAAGTSSSTHPAKYMNDGRGTTYWAASSTAVPQIVTINLGSARSLTASDVSWKVRSAPGFRVYGSNDATVWTQLANQDANTLKTTHTVISGSYRYVRIRINKLNSGSAGIYEWKLYAATATPTPTPTATVTPTPTPTATVTPTPTPTATVTPTPTPTATVTPTPTPTATVTPTPTPTATGLAISSLSTTHAAVGASVTINGSGFGATQGAGKVTFGERPQHTFTDGVTLTPCSRTATVTSWSDTRIVVTVPSMSPGIAEAAGTHHPVYVTTAAGALSGSSDFYIDPAIVIDGSTSAAVSTGVLPYSVRTVRDTTYANTTGSRHGSYTTHVVYDATSSNPGGGNFIAGNTHDVLFRDCTFTDNSPLLNGYNAGVLTIGEGATNIYNITFENCVFTNNLSSGGDGTGANGVKTYHANNAGKMGDWTFSDCSFGTPNSPGGSFLRMSLEVNEDDYMTSGYIENVRVTGCDFEPPACEPISFNCRMRGPDRKILIDDSTFKGAGQGYSPWGGAVFESTGYGMVIRDTSVWAWSGSLFNLEGWGSGIQSHQYFKNITADQTRLYQNTTGSGSVVFSGFQHSYGVWENCDFNLGNASNGCAYFCQYGTHGSTSPGWVDCTYEDLSTSYIHGNASWAAGYLGRQPTNTLEYWLAYDCNPVAEAGSPSTAYAANHISWPIFGSRP